MRLDGIQFMRSMNIQRIPYLRPESDEPRSVSDDACHSVSLRYVAPSGSRIRILVSGSLPLLSCCPPSSDPYCLE